MHFKGAVNREERFSCFIKNGLLVLFIQNIHFYLKPIKMKNLFTLMSLLMVLGLNALHLEKGFEINRKLGRGINLVNMFE